ncbi:AAA-ATPase At3g50940 [Rosa chinensis]|nr:AAA-ATPase At3g50940 [Rosa chinensis]
MSSYLDYVVAKAKEIKNAEKVLRIYSRCTSGSYKYWESTILEHPCTFETLAMDPTEKKMIMDDLDRFVRRKEFYKKVGKAWKRGYLLYGPPGTGKSSLIAAMANYLNYNIYDLELTSISNNSDLRHSLLSTTNRSILIIEDIDCSLDIQNREKEEESDEQVLVLTKDKNELKQQTVTLSGLLNFIDGLWSSCGDERIIVFTTNYKDKLDPALLRPGRMDVHIHMSYCTVNGFKILASRYLDIHDHPLFAEIEGLMQTTEVTPAQVAGQLQVSYDADVALAALVKFIKEKKEEDEKKEKEKKKEAQAKKLRRKRLLALFQKIKEIT